MKIVRKGMIVISLMIAIGFLSGCESKEDIYDQGYGDGADDGYSDGYDDGYSVGYDDAMYNMKKIK